MKALVTQFDRDAKEYVEVLPKDEGKAMNYVLNKLTGKKETAKVSRTLMTVASAEALFDDEYPKKKKGKGLKGSNTPEESQDFVQGLGVDSGPDGGNIPSGGGYGEGASAKRLEASISKRLEVAGPVKKDSLGREFILFRPTTFLDASRNYKGDSVIEKAIRKALDKNIVPFAGVSILKIFFKSNGDYNLYGPFYFYGKDKEVFAWNGVDTEDPNGFKLKVYKPLPDFLKKLPKTSILKP